MEQLGRWFYHFESCLFVIMQIKRQFMAGSLAYRAPYAVEGELNRDFQPVLAAQMVWTVVIWCV